MAKVTKIAVSLLLPLLVVGLALADDEKAAEKKPTDKALDFELKDSAGKTHKLSDYRDKVVVLEWTNPGCPYVVRHYDSGTFKKLSEKYAEKGVVWIAINSSHFAKPEEMEEWRKKWNLSYPMLLDTGGSVGRAFGAKTTPHMFVMKNGKKLYDGAIDDGRKGQPTRNYVATALDEILAGKTVSMSTTKPYGCGVKYAGIDGS